MCYYMLTMILKGLDMDITMIDTMDDTATITKTVTKMQKPKLYNIVFLNDDFTPMQFVVKVLEEIYFKNREESLAIMLEVHHLGRGIAGTYSREIAEEKLADTLDSAQINEFPLKAIIEPVPGDDEDSE